MWELKILDVNDAYFNSLMLVCRYLFSVHFVLYGHYEDHHKTQKYMSHFAYACKMRYPLNLVLEKSEYLWF